MRAILDTNVLLSALMGRGTPPDQIYQVWLDRRFGLVSCEQQPDEINRVSRRLALRARLRASEVGTMVNHIRHSAWMAEPVHAPVQSSDPADDYLLGLAHATQADFLVTGDKRDLLRLGRLGSTSMVTARGFVSML